jgi:branched-chain amino acid transport system ATP-binding protein
VTALLELRGVQSAYGDSQVLYGIDLRIEPGQVVTLIGRNGMGKSTTVKGITALHAVCGGEVLLNGERIDHLAPEAVARRGIALVPEGRRVFSNLTVRENLIAFARPPARGASGGAWDLDRVFGQFPSLARRASNYGDQLSGGEQQMLAIGRALLRNGSLLVIDEATEGLAPLIRQEIWQCLAGLKREGLAMLVIDKYLKPLLALGDMHYVIDRGSVAWHGDSRALAAAPEIWERHVGVA